MPQQFIIEGARKDTGDEVRLVLEAHDAAQAMQLAKLHDLFVAEIRPAETQVRMKSFRARLIGSRRSS